MFTQALLPDTIRGINLLSNNNHIKKAYLAGGSSLALHLGHRISEDLDFFTLEEFDEEKLSNELKQIPEFKEQERSWRTLKGTVGKTKFSLFYYPYDIIKPLIQFDGINILDKEDIAAMKLHAIEDRGVKRDFIDMYFLTREFSLEQVLGFYDQKYHNLDERLLHLIKSLGYLEDADHDDWTPNMLVEIDWDEIKNFFTKESIRLAKTKLDI